MRKKPKLDIHAIVTFKNSSIPYYIHSIDKNNLLTLIDAYHLLDVTFNDDDHYDQISMNDVIKASKKIVNDVKEHIQTTINDANFYQKNIY